MSNHTGATGDDVVVSSALRSPIGTYRGGLSGLSASQLGEQVVRALLERTGLDPTRVDDLILGQCYPNGEEPAVGRVVALDSGLPVTVAGTQVDRRCGSGLQAVLNASMQVGAGVSDVVIAGGAESMSRVEWYTQDRVRDGVAEGPLLNRLARARVTAGGRDYPVPGGMLETAENVRRTYGITRQEQDALALESHRRAIAAQDDGTFDQEIVPIKATGADGQPVLVDRDETPRRSTNADALAGLKPVLLASDPDATVTAGNASTQNDGASVCVVTTRRTADELGLVPMGRVLSWAAAGVPPNVMGIGPVPATAKVLDRLGLTLADLDLIELNEAFAAQVLGVTREWAFGPSDFERTNVHGSGISLGHPVGATGCRMLTTLLHELGRRGGGRGLVTMCIGGGQGLAAVVESQPESAA